MNINVPQILCVRTRSSLSLEVSCCSRNSVTVFWLMAVTLA